MPGKNPGNKLGRAWPAKMPIIIIIITTTIIINIINQEHVAYEVTLRQRAVARALYKIKVIQKHACYEKARSPGWSNSSV